MPTIFGPDGSALATDVCIASRLRDRLVGLIGAPTLAPRQALVIPNAAQVHTFGLRCPIDVAFCDGHGEILHVITSMKPGRMSRWVRGSAQTIEMADAMLASLRRGDVLRIRGL